jgi:hypothetical protein
MSALGQKQTFAPQTVARYLASRLWIKAIAVLSFGDKNLGAAIAHGGDPCIKTVYRPWSFSRRIIDSKVSSKITFAKVATSLSLGIKLSSK